MRVPRMNDSPAASERDLVGLGDHPRVCDTVTSGSWRAMKVLMTGSIVAVSARLPSKAATVSGNPSRR